MALMQTNKSWNLANGPKQKITTWYATCKWQKYPRSAKTNKVIFATNWIRFDCIWKPPALYIVATSMKLIGKPNDSLKVKETIKTQKIKVHVSLFYKSKNKKT